MLHNSTFRRAISSFFLFELISSIVAPSLSYALMGPSQPEFTSYESPGSTDMVNLSTGDMTYSVPILELPGPETTFSLPLTYRAGIRPEQEASWVGLGWNINPGAIARNVNGYPDDASGEFAVNSYTDPGHRGWYGGVPGILSLGWDSETGRSGSASLLGFVNASWSGGKLQSGDIIGIGAARGEGAGIVNPVAFVGAIASLATAGIGSALSAGAKIAMQAGGALATGVGIAAFGKLGPSGGGFSQPTIVKDHTWFRTNYWVFSNDTTKEAMFGSLYFDRMGSNTTFGDFANANNYGPNVYDGPTNYQAGKSRKGFKFNYTRAFTDKGNFAVETAADMQQFNFPGQDYRVNSSAPVSIAHDDFSVMGPGISGSIRPQRLDVGSLAYPRQMLERHDKYNLVPWQPYKVAFRYDNSASNTYTYSANTNAASTTSPVGVDASHWNSSQLVLIDPKLYSPAQTTAAAPSEPNRKGLANRRLVQGKHIEWYTNKEIADAYERQPFASPILEYASDLKGWVDKKIFDGYEEIPTSSPDEAPTYEPKYRTEHIEVKNNFRRVRPENGIGAFVITAEDGTTYHYSLPVYHFRQFSKTTPTDPTNKGVATTRRGTKGTDVYNYATAWLLTAITGPDYIDQGTIGVVDDQDMGTWVKFSYGKFSKQYKWRQPYVGQETSPGALGASTFQEGAKETYYLNSIATRTHTALFLKSVRQDGRGHYTPGSTSPTSSNLGIVENTPSSSLRLDEVIVLSNQDLAAIKASTGFNEDTGNNSINQNYTLGGLDSFKDVLDQNDVGTGNNNIAIRPLLNQKALKRIVFNYSYRLCIGMPNSFTSATAAPTISSTYSATKRLGKLTLESIATYGPNNVKLIPDFRFDYGYNPKYDPNKWDAFGMYCGAGSANSDSHKPSVDFAQASQDGAAWSLTKITSPLGAITEFAYERDQYASISDIGNQFYQLTDQGAERPNGVLVGNNMIDLTSFIKPNDKLYAKINVAENYYGTERQVNGYDVDWGPSTCYSSFTDYVTVSAVTPNSITIADPPGRAGFETRCVPTDNANYTYTNIHSDYGGCSIAIGTPLNRNGGDIRVAAVTTRDEANHAYTIKYKYANALVDGRNSSGVISKEPEYIKKEDFWFYNSFDYPATPVMYGQTTVLRGNFTTPTDIDQREEYAFYTASSLMVRPTYQNTDTKTTYPFLNASGNVTLRQRSNSIAVDIGLLGQAKSIRRYNSRGTQEFSTVFNYATSLPNAEGITSQGTFTEGALVTEFLDVDNEHSTNARYNINWTTKQYLPTTLLSTTTTTNNIAATTTNKLYDFYTGAVLETALTNSLGDTYRGRTVPAYTVYTGMGPKSENAGNQHMLTQTAATYSYKENGTNNPSVLTAGIQTWKSDWATYRLFDPTADRYKAEPNIAVPIWRQHRTFVWQSPRLNPDGTYASFVAYKWNQTQQAPNWLNVGEVALYDHYSRPLESRDVNGQYATQKVGYDQSQVIAAATNARYTEIAYSGAEDLSTSGASAGHFGGEVRDGGRQSADQQHTGRYSSLLTAANTGFTYKAIVGNNNDLRTDRAYRASVWVYNADPSNSAANGARLYVTLNGTTYKEVGLTDPATKRAGQWYLLNLVFDLPISVTGQQLVVGCRNTGNSNVYVDDFRFQPLESPLQTNVYDPATRQVTHMLDNDNLYTKYQYDEGGKVVKVYKEVLTPSGSTASAERLVKESSYNYAQMRTPNWIDAGTVCATNAAGQTTGYLARKYRDVNSASPTYNQEKLEATNEQSIECPSQSCSGCNRYNNATQSCEQPTEVQVDCTGDTSKYFIVYQYQYRDGTFCLNPDGSPKQVRRATSNPCYQ